MNKAPYYYIIIRNATYYSRVFNFQIFQVTRNETQSLCRYTYKYNTALHFLNIVSDINTYVHHQEISRGQSSNLEQCRSIVSLNYCTYRYKWNTALLLKTERFTDEIPK